METVFQSIRRQPVNEVCDIQGRELSDVTLQAARLAFQEQQAEERTRQQRLLQAVNMTIGVKLPRDVRITPLREI